MVRGADVGVHINFVEKFDCLVDSSGVFQEICNCGGCCEVGFFGVLMSLHVVAAVFHIIKFVVDFFHRQRAAHQVAKRHIDEHPRQNHQAQQADEEYFNRFFQNVIVLFDCNATEFVPISASG